jgi:hypothetical protein
LTDRNLSATIGAFPIDFWEGISDHEKNDAEFPVDKN